MKYFYKFLSVVAIVALMAGCTKEQSSLNVSDIPGSATIIGSYYYDAGQDWDYDEEVYIQKIKPLANHVVYAEVENASLKAGAKGVTVYETTTDATGNFSIVVPAVNGGTKVTVYSKPFMGKHSTFVSVEDNEPIFDNNDVVYASAKEVIVVNPHDIKIHDAYVAIESEREDIENYPYTWTFTVTVKEGVYERIKTEGSYDYNDYQTLYVGADDVNVIVKVAGKNYGATTNSKGLATFVIPAAEQTGSAKVTATVSPYLKNNFRHYYLLDSDGSLASYTLSGTYEMFNGDYTVQNISKNLTFMEFSSVDPNIDVNMVFIPFADIENPGGYSVSKWINDCNSKGKQN